MWQQMYDPQRPAPDATITERMTHGRPYGPRRRMILVGIVEHYNAPGITRWKLLPHNPDDRRGEFPWSLVESDWCVLSPDDTDPQERLF